jgi:hypothetical protein
MTYTDGQQFALAQLSLEKDAGLAELLNILAMPAEAIGTAGRYGKDIAHIGGRAVRDVLPAMTKGEKARRAAAKAMAEAPLPAREAERFRAAAEHARTGRLPEGWTMAPEGLTPVHISELSAPRYRPVTAVPPPKPIAKAASCFTNSESTQHFNVSGFSKQARTHLRNLRPRHPHLPRAALPSQEDGHVKESNCATWGFFRDKTAATPSQEEIFEEALAALPEHIRSKVLHASGGLPDARGDLSDVDMTYYTRYPHGLLRKMPEGTIAERRDPEHTIYTLPGYPREVNLYATMNRARARRAPAHRDTAIALQLQYPELAEAARKLKSGGLGTEKAWAKVLGVEGDPYEEMLNREKMLALAEALAASKTAKAHKLSRRMEFRGLKISVETDKGESRHWYDPNNKEKGSTKMKFPYGYIRMTKGIDGDHVDVYVGPNEDAKNVYVVHQQRAPNFDKYDEDKCMLGFDSADAAKKAYLDHYNDDRFFGSMTVMPFEQFKTKVLGTFKRPQKIAGTNLKFMLQLERDFGKNFARRFFEETTRAAKGATKGTPMTAVIQKGRLMKVPMPPPLPQQVQLAPKVATVVEKLAAEMAIGTAMKQVRRLLKAKDVDAAHRVAQQAIRSGAVEAPMLKRFATPAAGVTPHEAKLWDIASRSSKLPRTKAAPVATTPVTAPTTPAATPTTPDLVDPNMARSWAKTKQQMGWA